MKSDSLDPAIGQEILWVDAIAVEEDNLTESVNTSGNLALRDVHHQGMVGEGWRGVWNVAQHAAIWCQKHLCPRICVPEPILVKAFHHLSCDQVHGLYFCRV